MTNTAAATPTSTPAPRVLALIGLDRHGKGHGAAFGADDADLARKAASILGPALDIAKIPKPGDVAPCRHGP